MINGIRIRLARHGMKNAPVYHIVAIPAGKAREARPLEKLGEYDPIPRVRSTDYIPVPNRVFGGQNIEPPKEKNVSWDVGRIKWWISQGAEPTATVVKLLSRAGVIKHKTMSPRKLKALRELYKSEASPTALVREAGRQKEKADYAAGIEEEAQNKDAERRAKLKAAADALAASPVKAKTPRKPRNKRKTSSSTEGESTTAETRAPKQEESKIAFRDESVSKK